MVAGDQTMRAARVLFARPIASWCRRRVAEGGMKGKRLPSVTPRSARKTCPPSKKPARLTH